ncbi:hypothetical protein [Streptomyces violaceusniger]|nr:hypothetical protein [Streptomyces violaceusniger]
MVDLAHHSTAAPAGPESAPTAARPDTVLVTPAEPARRRPPAWLLTTAIAIVTATTTYVQDRRSAAHAPSPHERTQR